MLSAPNKMDTYFEFLNHLRESGKINMFGAPAVLVEAFNIPSKEAKEIFWAWTQNFEDGEEE